MTPGQSSLSSPGKVVEEAKYIGNDGKRTEHGVNGE